MISRVEHIGQQSTWPRRLRHWLKELFGSNYVRLLERDLLQARLERDRAVTDLKAMQERLLEVMAATKGIPWRPLASPEVKAVTPAKLPPTRWQHLQDQAIAENARLEAEDAKKEKPVAQEN